MKKRGIRGGVLKSRSILHKPRHSQISMEYLMIVGFVTFAIIGILGIAFAYSGTIKDRIKMSQLSNFAYKVISTSETIFYSGEPSKATITTYLPDNIKEINIIEDSLVFTVQTNSGITKLAFSSQVPIDGSIDTSPGIKRLRIIAQSDKVLISST